MELTLKEKLYYYKAFLKRIEKLKDNFIELDMILTELGIDKEYEIELKEIYEETKEFYDFMENEIKDKLNIKTILNKEIDKIRIEEILRY